MPLLPDVINISQGSQFFGSFDFLQEYGQIPPAEGSQERQSIGTPFGVEMPMRVLPGRTNATCKHVWSCPLDNICDKVAIWPDDVAPPAATETEFLDALEAFYRHMQQACLTLHAACK
jgi:hypothetical protein